MNDIIKLYQDIEARKFIVNNLKVLNALNDEEYNYVKNVSGSRTRNSDDIVDVIFNVAKKMGLEELVDLSDMDETNIAVFSARNGDNPFHHNYGKGTTYSQAKISAMMEFIERMSADGHNPTSINEKYIDIINQYNIEIVKPSDLITNYIEYVANSTEINWIPAINITNLNCALIPAISVLFPYAGDKTPLYLNNTNGLSAGSTYQEAILQGIYEVIERDIISFGLGTGVMSDVNADSVRSEAAINIINELEKNDIKVYIKYIENDFNIPCFIVTGDDTKSKTPSLLCGGYGCHSNKEIALIRALTELVQSRKSLLYGKRADIVPFKTDGSEEKEYCAAKLRKKVLYEHQVKQLEYDNIPEYRFKNLKEELAYLIELLNENKMNVYIANLTENGIENALPVVRVIIPGLENWYDTRERIGKRLYERIYCK